MVVLAYLGALGNEFLCKQWERKGMHTDIYFYVQYGTRGKCPSFSCKFFFLTLLKCRFILCLIINSTRVLFHVRAIVTCDQPDSADAWITFSQKVLRLVCAGWGWSALSSMATRRSLTDWDIMHLILEYPDVQSSEDKDISTQRDSDTGDTTDTNFAQWPDNTNMSTYSYCSPQVYRSQWVMAEAPHINKTLPHRVFSCSSVLKVYNCWWKRQIAITTSTWTHRTKDGPHCLVLQFRICVCFWHYCAGEGMIRGTCWMITGRY